MKLPTRRRPNDYGLTASFDINPVKRNSAKVSVEPTEQSAHDLALLENDLPGRVSKSAGAVA